MNLFQLAERFISKHKAWSAATTVLYSIAVLMLVVCLGIIYYLAAYISMLERTFQNEYSLYVNNIVYVISFLAIGIILSFSLIYGIILLTTYSFEKTAELLRLCGITPKLMFRILCYICMILCIPGAIIGAAAEIVFCVLIKSSLDCDCSLYLYTTVSLLIVLALLIFGVSLICQNKISKPGSYSSFMRTSIKLKTRNPVLLLGIKSYIVNRQSFAVFIVMAEIALSLSGFISNFMFVNTEQPDFYDMRIDSYDTTHSGKRHVSLNPFYSISEEDMYSLSQEEGIEKIRAVKWVLACVIPDSLFCGDADEFDFSENDEVYDIDLTSVFGMDYSELEAYVVDGTIDINKLDSGEEAIYCDNGDAKFHAGETVNFSIMYYGENGEPQRTDFTSTIGAVLNLPNDYGTDLDSLTYSVLLSNQVMSELLPELGYKTTYIQLKDIIYSNAVKSHIYSIKCSLSDKNGLFLERFWQQEAQMTRDFCGITETIGWAFNIILMLISLVYMSSFMITGIEKNAGGIYTKLAIGMSVKQILGAALLENMINCVRALLIGAVPGVLYGVILSLFSGTNFMRMIPYPNMLIFGGIMLALALLVTLAIYMIAIDKRSLFGTI